MKLYHFIPVFFIFCLFPLASSAQTIPEVEYRQPLEIILNPEYPQPGGKVTATASIYGPTLNETSLIWYLNGVEIGRGQRTVSFDAGPAGSRSTLRAIGSTSSGQPLSKNRIIAPAYVDLFYNAETITPPFYKGKALLTRESDYTIEAVPYVANSSGRKLSNSQIDFTWKIGSSVIADKSGVGRNTFSAKSGVLSSSNTVSVEVKPAVGAGSIGRNSIRLPFSNPEVYLVEDNPLYGYMYNNLPTGDYTLEGDEITLRATPYFFPRGPGLVLDWRLNNEKISEDLINNLGVTFRNDNDASGKSYVSLRAQNTDSSLRNASINLGIIFGQ